MKINQSRPCRRERRAPQRETRRAENPLGFGTAGRPIQSPARCAPCRPQPRGPTTKSARSGATSRTGRILVNIKASSAHDYPVPRAKGCRSDEQGNVHREGTRGTRAHEAPTEGQATDGQKGPARQTRQRHNRAITTKLTCHRASQLENGRPSPSPHQPTRSRPHRSTTGSQMTYLEPPSYLTTPT